MRPRYRAGVDTDVVVLAGVIAVLTLAAIVLAGVLVLVAIGMRFTGRQPGRRLGTVVIFLFGFQIGGSETEVVMLVMNRKGMDRLLTNKFTLGGDASIAAGPVGRTTTAKTDAAMTAEILSWSRSRGVFAGVSLSGATLREDTDTNKDLYGKPLSNREILDGSVKPPANAAALMAAVSKY